MQRNDNKAKTVITDYLVSEDGHDILDSEEDFSFDIKSKKNDGMYYSEVEMKKSSGLVIGIQTGKRYVYHTGSLGF